MSNESDPLLASWHSYPSIFALGHRALERLLDGPVLVEEKVDGSQFSFGLFRDGLRARSKGAQLNIVAPERMFERAIASIQTLDLHPGWTYRGEYLQKPKHNALAYDRVPAKNVILFDINRGHEDYLSPDEKAEEASRLGLEIVPAIYHGVLADLTTFRDVINRISVLGGQKVEGVVVKNYGQFGPDKKVLMGKYVSEAFKEVHAHEWKEANPTSTDIIERIVTDYRTPARWAKALQHMKEAGQIEGSPRDIGIILKEVWPDIEKECKDEIKERLYQWAQSHVRRGVTRGLPEWYKDELVKLQFEGGE